MYNYLCVFNPDYACLRFKSFLTTHLTKYGVLQIHQQPHIAIQIQQDLLQFNQSNNPISGLVREIKSEQVFNSIG